MMMMIAASSSAVRRSSMGRPRCDLRSEDGEFVFFIGRRQVGWSIIFHFHSIRTFKMIERARRRGHRESPIHSSFESLLFIAQMLFAPFSHYNLMVVAMATANDSPHRLPFRRSRALFRFWSDSVLPCGRFCDGAARRLRDLPLIG